MLSSARLRVQEQQNTLLSGCGVASYLAEGVTIFLIGVHLCETGFKVMEFCMLSLRIEVHICICIPFICCFMARYAFLNPYGTAVEFGAQVDQSSCMQKLDARPRM